MLASSRPRYTTSINILSSGLSFTTAGTSSTLCGTPAVHDKSLFITMIQCINCTYLPNSHKSSINSDLFTCYRTLVNFSLKFSVTFCLDKKFCRKPAYYKVLFSSKSAYSESSCFFVLQIWKPKMSWLNCNNFGNSSVQMFHVKHFLTFLLTLRMCKKRTSRSILTRSWSSFLFLLFCFSLL